MDKVLNFSHKVLEKVITKEDITIDMTLGAGNDSKFLANISKKVYSFDIQEKAIEIAKGNLKEFNNIEYILDGHENVLKYVPTKVKGIIFNLGYLPTGDKNITTMTKTTISAIKDSLTLLLKKGVMAICLYPGHPEGKKESIEVLEFVKGLNQKEFEVLKYEFINQVNEPPFLICIEKI